MRKPGNIIGVDLGGTTIRAGKVIDGKIIQISKIATPSTGSENEVLSMLVDAIGNCFDNETQCIGVGVPSVVDTQKGIVYDVVNIPSWKEVALRDFLTEKFSVPVFINNDSNCFVAGEKIYGKGKSYRDIVGMTLGTGLGLGIVVEGKLYEGRNCGAGEFGMIPYRDDVFETYCSGQFFSKIKNRSAMEVHTLALDGDSMAMELFSEYGVHMGKVIKSILYAYDPEIIILGGSVSCAYSFFQSSMKREIEDFAFRSTLCNLKIEVSDITDSAILGAAALQMNAHNKL